MVAELALRLDHLFVMHSRQGGYQKRTSSATKSEILPLPETRYDTNVASALENSCLRDAQ